MNIEERSYGGKVVRPRPIIHSEPESNLLIVATPWGARSSAQKAVDSFKDYFLTALADMESTSPFTKLSCLNPVANVLRSATFLANDSLFSEENKDEYLSGMELFAIAKFGNELSYIQIGQPSAILVRQDHPLLPLATDFDLSTEIAEKSTPPLPKDLLGLHSTSNFAVKSFCPKAKDRLLLVSRSYLPREMYQLDHHDANLQSIAEILTQDNDNLPFWVGTFGVD